MVPVGSELVVSTPVDSELVVSATVDSEPVPVATQQVVRWPKRAPNTPLL